MIDEYVEWLLMVYAEKTGTDPRTDDPDVTAKAARFLLRHNVRGGRLLADWPGVEEFVSLVASEMADRLGRRQPGEPFLKILDNTADAVRHRIAREVRRRAAHVPAGLIEGQVAPGQEPEKAMRVLEAELREQLSFEEQAVLSLCLEGSSVDEMVKALKMSKRTVYRKLKTIEQSVKLFGQD